MSKKLLIIILAVLFLAASYWVLQLNNGSQGPEEQNFTLDPQNCAYVIDGKTITLANGYSEEEIAPGSASKLITRYFGNEVSEDLNNDGIADIAFILTQDAGGSGTFYYVAIALGGGNKCNGTNAILLGDRISPQTISFKNGEINVNYAERNPNEPMTAIPSVGFSKYFRIDSGKLVEVNK